MSNVFEPYEGCAEDIERVASFATPLDWPTTAERAAAKRLLAAISEPKCGKVLRYGSAFVAAAPGGPIITCTLPADHDGPHADETLNGAWS